MDALLRLDEPSVGSWNMALDEALLELAADRQATVVRFYGWSEPTLSLGYFQKFADRGLHASSAGCALVRRASGGGAILHDRELTYSFAAPVADRVAGNVRELYDAFHETLVDELRAWGVTATLCVEPIRRPAAEEPFLCFQRRSEGDVLVGDFKICGSAQRRRQGAVLQHGSLLLDASPAAPELPGVWQTAGVRLDAEPFRDRWLGRVSDRLGIRLTTGDFFNGITDRASNLQSEQFGHLRWLEKR